MSDQAPVSDQEPIFNGSIINSPITPVETILADEIREVPLTPSQATTLGRLADKVESANEVAEAANAVVRAKQAALDSALQTVFELAGVDPGDSHCVLVRQLQVVRLIPKSALPR